MAWKPGLETLRIGLVCFAAHGPVSNSSKLREPEAGQCRAGPRLYRSCATCVMGRSPGRSTRLQGPEVPPMARFGMTVTAVTALLGATATARADEVALDADTLI